MYIYNHVHTYQMWVNEVFLDRRMTMLQFFCILWHFLLIMGRPIIFLFLLFWRCVSLFFIVFVSNYMVQPKVILPPWRNDMDFKKKPVYREKSGRHSNLIYLVLKPLFKNPGRQFSDFSVFRRCFSLLFSGFLFWRWFSLIFHYFEDVVHSCSMIFHYFLDVFNYFSLIVQCVYMFFIMFHWFFNVLKMFFIIFHCIVG